LQPGIPKRGWSPAQFVDESDERRRVGVLSGMRAPELIHQFVERSGAYRLAQFIEKKNALPDRNSIPVRSWVAFRFLQRNVTNDARGGKVGFSMGFERDRQFFSVGGL